MIIVEKMTRLSNCLRGSLRSLFGVGVVAAGMSFGTILAAAATREDSTPQQIFDSMRSSFQPAKAKGVHARYQWDLSGPNGGEWWIDVEDGTYKMGKGKIPNPSVTFIAKDKDWVAICHDQLSGTWAYVSGRLKVRGDQGIARKLGEIFP